MKLSIIILCHNNHHLTIQCTNFLSRCILPLSTEIILVDNASEPPYTERSFSKFNLNFKLIRNSSNLSFSKANNIATRKATGELLLFLNNDIQLFKNTIQQLLLCYEEGPKPAVIGGKLIYPDKQQVQHAGIFHMIWGIASNYGVGASPNHHEINFRRETDALSGAMLLIQSTFFNKIGKFDEEFYWGYEDIDLCMKARKHGATIIFEPKSEAIHHESYTLKNTKMSLQDENNYKAYRQKWDKELIPKENHFLESKLSQKYLNICIYGQGMAAKRLYDYLHKKEINIGGFIDFDTTIDKNEVWGQPIESPEKSIDRGYDLIIIGSQYFFDIFPKLNKYYKKDMILNPILT
ncbi:glycosyltransferase family 2 protein [Opitutales bacterium]|nr:glycosyltransferase family 2 protein [Opitutales bacterium]